MRWVFYSLLILNVVYLVAGLVGASGPDRDRAPSPVASSAPESLKLLSEVEVTLHSGAATAADRERLCPVIGPWSDRARALEALTELENGGYQGTVRSLRVEKERLNWVYLPAFPSRDEALKVLRELQSRGVDSFIVGEGEDENAISLGYFTSEESAEGLRVKMNNAGYPAEVRRTARTVTEYWVYLKAASIADDGTFLRVYLGEHPELEADHAACPGGDARQAPGPAEAPAGEAPSEPVAEPAPENPSE